MTLPAPASTVPAATARHRSSPAARVGLALLLASLVVVLAWHFAARAADEKKGDDKKPPPPVVVTTAAVQSRDVPIFRAGLGTVTAAQSVTVRTRVDGQLEKVGFVEGQDVKAGQLLAQLDPRTLRAQLQQVQAQKAKDQATLANARVDLQRYQQLIAEEASTPQQLDTQKALVAQLEATVQNDQAQVAYAQTQLSFTTIVAPISGRVGARLVDPGNIVHAADTNGLVVINQIDPIAVVFTLPEEAFQDVNRAINERRASRQALAVQAYPRTGNDLLGTGSLVLVNNQIDTATGTVQLKGSFPNPAHTLWPGQFVNVRLVLGQRRGALTIPAAAVQRGPEGTYTYLLQPDGRSVQIRPIRLGPIQDNYAVVEQGLEPGQKVVVEGQYKLKPGSAVTEAAPRKGGGASGARGGAASGPDDGSERAGAGSATGRRGDAGPNGGTRADANGGSGGAANAGAASAASGAASATTTGTGTADRKGQPGSDLTRSQPGATR